MAATTYSVTSSEVVSKLPFDSSQIGASTEPLSTSDIDEYLAEADAELTGIIKRGGLNPASLDDDTTQQIQTAIKAYAVAESLDAMGMTGGSRYEKYREKWLSIRDYYADTPTAFSEDIDRVESNIDTTDDKTEPEFIGVNYEF